MGLFELDRRHFLAGAGSLFISTINSQAKEKVDQSDSLLASCVKHRDGHYGAVLLDHNLDLVKHISLPDRGHDIVFSPTAHKAVAFARRPGNFAVIFDTTQTSEPMIITAPTGRHFYGHGVFSKNGKLLYASENDFENAIGKIGIYDATSKFKRVGEFDSFGIGPHEILLLEDGKTLVVANGGIETHPDFGRAKLNLATMQSSIAFIDITDGSLLERHLLPDSLNKLSLRHMVQITNDTIVFGGQYQGSKQDRPQLIGTCKFDEGLKFWRLAKDDLEIFANYTGSLAVDRTLKQVAVSSPVRGVTGIFDTTNGSLLSVIKLKNGNGVTYQSNNLLSSSEGGILMSSQPLSKQYGFAFDNHLSSNQII